MKSRAAHNSKERIRKKKENESFQMLSNTLNLAKCSKKDIIDAAVHEIISLRQFIYKQTEVSQNELKNKNDDSTDYFLDNPLDRYLESIH